MKWASIKATRNPTADEMRRWGHLAKPRVYQMEMEKHYEQAREARKKKNIESKALPILRQCAKNHGKS